MAERRVRIANPILRGNEKQYVIDALERNELSWHGQYVRRFEQRFATYVDTEHALAVTNGTAALHLALLAIDIQPNDLVIVPALTYVATANAVRYCGAIPIICDVDPKTWCLNPESVERAVDECGGNIKAIIAVHLYGVPCDMFALRDICNKHGLLLIEDAAQALGAEYHNRRVGSLSDIAAFSLFANKIITTGEGGMITAHSSVYMMRANYLRGQCQDRAGQYFHSEVGYNYRMTNIQAAIGLAQLEQIYQLIAGRERVRRYYDEAFDGVFETQSYPSDTFPICWMYSVLVPEGVSRDGVIQQLEKDGIETRPIFTPLDQLPMYLSSTPCPLADRIARRGINLPTHPDVTKDDIAYVVEHVRSAVGQEYEQRIS